MLQSVEQVVRDEALARDEAWTRLGTELDLDATDPELVSLVLDDPAATYDALATPRWTA